ncbi:unnamed protein product [Closterium sp. NIES-54]
MTTLRVLLHVAAQRDYELHSLDFSTAFLQGNLHEEIWLRRPPGFTEPFPAGTQWSLRRPVYGLRQALRKWHDTLRTTLAALGFGPATTDPSLFLRTDTSLPPFYVLVYVDDLVFATADTEALTLVKSELQKRHTCTDLGELRSYLGLQITRDRARRTIILTQSHMVHQVLHRFGFQFSSPQPTPLSTSHSLLAPPLDESVEPSGPYPELVGCLILGSGSVSWRSTRSSSVLSSSCEAEIYAGAMAAHELRWLTYLLTYLGEQPRLPPVLYIDNKAMIALCQEHRLEHRTKHITLRYFLARELQQRGQLRLAYAFAPPLPGPAPPPCGIAPPYGPTAALTCGPATLTCGPRRPYLRTPPPLPAASPPLPADLPPLPAAPPPFPAALPPSPAASSHIPAVPAALNCGLAAPYLRPRRPYLRPRRPSLRPRRPSPAAPPPLTCGPAAPTCGLAAPHLRSLPPTPAAPPPSLAALPPFPSAPSPAAAQRTTRAARAVEPPEQPSRPTAECQNIML